MELSISLNKSKPHPNDDLKIYFTLRNKLRSSILIQEASLTVPWSSRRARRQIHKKLKPPTPILFRDWYDSCRFKFPVKIPKYIIGKHPLNLSLSYAILRDDGKWGQLRQQKYIHPVEISVTPRYVAFISRSVRPHESLIPNEISRIIRTWNFETLTFGIEVKLEGRSPEQVIGETIQSCDVIFAIATKRDQLNNGLGWRTLEYLQGEVGYSYAKNKPIFVLVDREVDLGGLASCFKPNIFDTRNFSEFKLWLNGFLYDVREVVKQWKIKKRREAIIKGIEAYVPTIAVSFLGGTLLGTALSRK